MSKPDPIALCGRCADSSMIVDLDPITPPGVFPLCYFCAATAAFTVPAYHYHGR